MSTSEPHTWGSNPTDAEMQAARAAGWARADLHWERLQEKGNLAFESGDIALAAQVWRRAWWIATFRFTALDPRRATTLANLALLDRHAGRKTRARRRFAKALRIWGAAPDFIASMQVTRRARSSLFHLRMEALHWDTYEDNLQTRYRAFAAETAGALDALAHDDPVKCRLFARWRGEKPSIFDDTRKFLAAALLVGGGARQNN
ncbi:tetratricopeptide repeat-containing protein [Roseovarius sp. 2305UL8-3]|uniref:tetratricopeptide repeat-containing protein n=1 Tax=Roseovarius conchicola TaxID=3121636 RepID=UPI003528249B